MHHLFQQNARNFKDMKKKFLPKGIRVCNVCPQPQLPTTFSFPNYKLTLPQKDSKVTTLKGTEKKGKARRGESKELF